MSDVDSLRERAKELRCLYRVQHLTLSSTLPLEEVFEQVVHTLGPGWQRPDTTGACIEYLDETYRCSLYDPDAPQLVEELQLGGKLVGRIAVSDSCPEFADDSREEVFLEEERQLLRSVANLLINFLEWRHLEVLGARLSPTPENRSAAEMEKMVKRTLLGLSHELRNPLTVITADLDLLRRDLSPELKEEVISELQRSAREMSTLLTDLMLFLRAETGVERPKLEEVELEQFVAGVVEGFNKQEGESRVLFLESNASSQLKVRLNRETTARILRDLISNGVLYSMTETVKVSVFALPDARVAISVKDEGCGIDEVHHDKLFEQFYRLESSRNKLTGGVGLGLPLARALARSQDSLLRFESRPGQGTEVQIVFDALPEA